MGAWLIGGAALLILLGKNPAAVNSVSPANKTSLTRFTPPIPAPKGISGGNLQLMQNGDWIAYGETTNFGTTKYILRSGASQWVPYAQPYAYVPGRVF